MRRLRRLWDRCCERRYVPHFLELFKDQVLAVVPIALLIILFVAIFLQRWQPSTGSALGGLVLVIIGLVFFLEGLRVYFVTLGEKIGEHLPEQQPTWVVLLVVGFFGVFVTYAEPATATLVPLGSLVSARTAPYAFLMLNGFRELTVLCVALGVAVAAVVGTLRFIHRWPIRWVIAASAAPCMILMGWMAWGTQDLSINIGLAWDCGAITGGPVTVPILLSMGAGVTKLHGDSTVSGYGIITLASLYPIFFVELLSIILGGAIDAETIAHARNAGELPIDKPPLQPLVSGLRSIFPLALVLMLVWHFLLKRPLPALTWLPSEGERPNPEEVSASSDSNFSWCSLKIYALGFLCAQIGIVIFNFGLSYGLVPQGANAGLILPATYTHLRTYWPSPRYSRGGGILLCMIFGFLIGFLATLAEPALHIMGIKVRQMTDGAITTSTLKYTVAVGVGLGTSLGVCRVIFQIPLIYLIIPTYAIAIALSFHGEEDVVALAWDSAGVTTGEVTVPFLLSLGLNFAIASKSADGFGLLTCASIGPVLSVLCLYYIKDWRRRRSDKEAAKAEAAKQVALQEVAAAEKPRADSEAAEEEAASAAGGV